MLCALFANDWDDAVGGIAEQGSRGEEIILQAVAALGWVIAEDLIGQFGDDQVAAFALGEAWHDGALAGAAHPEAGVGAFAEDAVAGIEEAGLEDGVEAELAEGIDVCHGLFSFEALLLCPEG